MRVAAVASCDIVYDGALRLGDGAARDFGRGRGLAGDLADRGGEFLRRACRRGDVHRGGADAFLGRACFGRHGVGRAVERRWTRSPAARPRRAPWRAPRSTVCSKRAIVARDRLGAALALAHGLLLRDGKLLALDRVVAEHDDGARHRADLVLGFGRRDIHACCRRPRAFSIAPDRRPSGRVMLRPMSQLKISPRHDDRDADPDDQQLGLLLRGGDTFGRRRRLARRRRR